MVWRNETNEAEGHMNTKTEQVIITLSNGTKLRADAIFSLHFSTGPASVTICGWKDGKNQTEDTFEIHEIASIDFPRNAG